MNNTLKFNSRAAAQARINALDNALNYPIEHGPEAQITPGVHVPPGVARTETCGAIIVQSDGKYGAILTGLAIARLNAPEQAQLGPPDRAPDGGP